MKEIRLLLLLSMLVSGCTSREEPEYTYTSDTLKIKSLRKNVFMHISYLVTTDFGKVDCNGMVYINGDEAIVFDTPTDDKAAAELIDWIEVTQGKKVKAVVVTHFHEDCLGGLKQFHTNGTKSYASNKPLNWQRTPMWKCCRNPALIRHSNSEWETNLFMPPSVVPGIRRTTLLAIYPKRPCSEVA